MKTLKDADLKDKRVLVRVDFNVPLNDELEITDDTRIQAAIPTINMIREKGGRVILMSHLGRPKSKDDEKLSLKPIYEFLKRHFGADVVSFSNDCIGVETEKLAVDLKAGQILLLENLRYYPEEEKGDEGFTTKLAKLGDVYVNDAFGTAHRAHASTSIIASHFPDNSYFGLLMDNEISNIEKVLNSYEKPFTAIIGGSKVSDKVGIILNLMDKADNILIGGAMAYTFLKAQGEQVGKSRVEEEKLDLAREILQKGIDKGIRILLPADSVCTKEFEENADVEIHESVNIPADMMGLDIGEKAIADYKQIIAESKTILWNGPMGVFEWDKFANGTKSIAFAVADASKTNGAYSLIGGGDSVAAINKFNLDEQVSYVSTGGGAMLEFLEGKELPGIAAIRGK